MKAENNEEYKKLTQKHLPKSPTLKNSLFAFFVGGFLCLLGELLAHLYIYLGVVTDKAYLLVTITFIIIASLATALGFFDKIAMKQRKSPGSLQICNARTDETLCLPLSDAGKMLPESFIMGMNVLLYGTNQKK